MAMTRNSTNACGARSRADRRSASWTLLAVAIMVGFNAALGCGSARPIIGVRLPEASNPPGGHTVKIAEVIDSRKLTASDLPESVLRPRAVGSYGKQVALLPDGSTVTNLVAQIVERAFQQAGYTIVSAGDSTDATAIPVSVHVEEFWAHGLNLSSTGRLEFRSRLLISGAVPPFEDGRAVEATISVWTYYPPIAMLFGNPRDAGWEHVVNAGVVALTEAVRSKVSQGLRNACGSWNVPWV